MARILCLAVVAVLAGDIRIQGQPRKDLPKNVTNSIGMKFVWISPGNFLMGSPKGEKNRRDDESQHKVTLTKGFYMGAYTVTQEEWKVVLGNNLKRYETGKNMPVQWVSWDDCQKYIKKLREKEKVQYRLPMEAEWEYACRAGSTTPYFFGNSITADQGNVADPKPKKLLPVGSFQANAWGLYDMHGNVFQWCQDWYARYPQKDVVDPKGPENGTRRVLRGASWITTNFLARSAYRVAGGLEPEVGSEEVGFRLCFSPD